MLNTKVHWPIPTGVAGPKLRSIHVEMNGIEAAGQLWENIHAAWWWQGWGWGSECATQRWWHGGDKGAARDEMNDKRTGWQGLGWIDKGRISWVDNGDKGRVENASPRDEWADNFGRITFPHRGHRAQLSPKLKLTFSISNTVAKSQKKLQSAAKLIFGDVFALD